LSTLWRGSLVDLGWNTSRIVKEEAWTPRRRLL
jgi:hypothetical protein